jgi:hypothetical protein
MRVTENSVVHRSETPRPHRLGRSTNAAVLLFRAWFFFNSVWDKKVLLAKLCMMKIRRNFLKNCRLQTHKKKILQLHGGTNYQ